MCSPARGPSDREGYGQSPRDGQKCASRAVERAGIVPLVRHVIVRRPGGYERLSLERAGEPRPGPDDVELDVSHSGVNFADCVVRMGLYESAKRYVGWPIVPGFEVAGVVRRAPAGARVQRGDRAIAVTRFGGYASRIALPARQVFAAPPGWTDAEGAGLLTTSLTAYHALVELAAPREGDAVLVHSAAGGVGSMLVQLARARGLFVTAIVGAPHKVSVARALGAHVVIDKSRERFGRAALAARPRGYAAVFDATGAETLADSYRCLAAPGRLVVYGFHSMLPKRGGRPSWTRLARTWLATPRFSPLAMTGENRSVMGFNLSYLFDDAARLDEAARAVLDAVARGALCAPATRVVPAAAVADAHRALESGDTVGKLALAW